jgi:hypothetical protein
MADEARRSILWGTQEEISRLSPETRAEFQRLYDEGRIGWVDPKLLGDAGKPPLVLSTGSYPVLRFALGVVKELNSGLKAALIPGRPAYFVPNVLGNVLLLGVHQGAKAAVNMRRALVAHEHLSEEGMQRLDAVAGTGIYESITGGQGPKLSLRTLARQIGRIWSPLVDNPFRRASLLYEIMREVGGSFSWGKIERFLAESDDQTLARIAGEANAAMIDYGRMGPVERGLIREVLLIYPWWKGSFRYAGRIFREHPTAAALFVQLGRYAEGQAKKSYGGIPVPSWLRYTGVVGGGIVNPASAGVLGTPSQAEDLIRFWFGKQTESGQPSEFLNPGLRMLGGALFPEPHKPFSFSNLAWQATLARTPQVALYQRLTGPPSPTSVYQPRNEWEKISPFVLGGIYPRGYSPEVVAKKGRAEQRASMSRPERAAESSQFLHDTLLREAKTAGLIPADATSLGPHVEEALAARAARSLALATAGVKAGDPGYQQAAWAVDVHLLAHNGRITPEQASAALAWAKDQTDDSISRARQRIGDKYFGGSTVTGARTQLKDELEHKAFLNVVAELEQAGKISKAKAEETRLWASTANRDQIAAARSRITRRYKLAPVPVPAVP